MMIIPASRRRCGIDDDGAADVTRVAESGRSVLLDDGATVVAPGATVDIRAEAVPNSQPYADRSFSADPTGDSRIVMGDGAVIDGLGADGLRDVIAFLASTSTPASAGSAPAPAKKAGKGKAAAKTTEALLLLGHTKATTEAATGSEPAAGAVTKLTSPVS